MGKKIKLFEESELEKELKNSKEIETKYGKLKISFFNVTDKEKGWYLPFENKFVSPTTDIIKTTSSKYISAQLTTNSNDLEYFLFKVYLPEIGQEYSSVGEGYGKISFEDFISDKGEIKREGGFLPGMDLLMIPYEAEKMKEVEISLDKITRKQWEEYPTEEAIREKLSRGIPKRRRGVGRRLDYPFPYSPPKYN